VPELVIAGFGLTVTTAVVGVPTHPLAVGVMVYVAVPAEIPVVVRIWLMTEPPELEPPVTPDWLTVHENDAPPTPLDKTIAGPVPLHNVCVEGVAIALGMGSTFTIIAAPAVAATASVTVSVYVVVLVGLAVGFATLVALRPVEGAHE
jgi:hypothetical protein